MESNPYAPSSVGAATVSPYIGGTQVAEGVINQLARTKPWVRFFSVLTFLGAGLMVVVSLVMLLAGAVRAQKASTRPDLLGISSETILFGMAVFYLILGVFYFYPGIKLWKYASRISALVYTRHEIDLESALNEQRAFWKFAGIAMIVLISLYMTLAVGAGMTAAWNTR